MHMRYGMGIQIAHACWSNYTASVMQWESYGVPRTQSGGGLDWDPPRYLILTSNASPHKSIVFITWSHNGSYRTYVNIEDEKSE